MDSAENWKRGHTLGLALIVLFFFTMAVRRPFGPYVSWWITMVAILVFIVVTGQGICGKWRGAFIDERNKVSLSRFQMLSWTVLIVSAFGTVALSRIANGDISAITALDITVPQTVWILMGISTTSLVGSPLIKSTKDVNPGQVVRNADVGDARWADLFMGEDVGKDAHLDLAKIQMFFFTLLLLLTYGAAIGSLLRADPTTASLPDVGQGGLMLLGISHSGYLVHKAIPTSNPPA